MKQDAMVPPDTVALSLKSIMFDVVFEHAGVWIPGLIIAAFILGVWFYLRPIWSSTRALRRATLRLRNGSTDHAVFQGAPQFLADLWKDYQQRRDGASVGLDGVHRTTVTPEEVFTEHAVLEGYNKNVAGTLAGVFTGLGILGTFIGLVNGLGKIDTSIDTSASTINFGAILALLGGMSTAFYTSIWGISFSLVWLLLDRATIHSLQRHAAHFFETVKLRYPVVSAEWFLHRLFEVENSEFRAIERSEKLLEEQKAILQNLGTDLATAFEDAIQNSFSQRLAPALNGVSDSISELQNQLGERQVAAMERLVQTFQERLSEQLGGQFEHLESAMRDAAEWQAQVHSELDQLIVRIRAAAEVQATVIERADAACDRYLETMEQMAASHELLSRSAESVKEASMAISAELRESTSGILV